MGILQSKWSKQGSHTKFSFQELREGGFVPFLDPFYPLNREKKTFSLLTPPRVTRVNTTLVTRVNTTPEYNMDRGHEAKVAREALALIVKKRFSPYQ